MIKMNVLLQRHCARYIYVVPDGLRELMSDISREVLRSQPEQLYTFIADYLDALMITRENARVASRLVEHITEISVTIVELLVRTGMSREDADNLARVIQEAFRRYLNKKEQMKFAAVYGDMREEMSYEDYVDEEEEFVREVLNEANVGDEMRHEAARIIQAAFRKFKKRQEYEKDLLFGMVDWRIAARHTISLYRNAGVSEEEANRAATLIKAAYKGYYTRRVMKRLLERGLDESVSEESIDEPFAHDLRGEEEEEDEDEETKKSVRIDFTSVIPHVDFGDPTVIETDQESKEPATPDEDDLLFISEAFTEDEEGEEILESDQITGTVATEEPPLETIVEEPQDTEKVPEPTDEVTADVQHEETPAVIEEIKEPPTETQESIPEEMPEAPVENIEEVTEEISPEPPVEVQATKPEGEATSEVPEIPPAVAPPPSEQTGNETDKSEVTETTEEVTTATEISEYTTEGETTAGETTAGDTTDTSEV